MLNPEKVSVYPPQLVTPNGVLVYDGPPVTPEWFAARREGITGTDLPKILGDSRYGNALSVWLDKRGELEDDDAMEAAHWGNILEDPVAQEWARRHGTSVSKVGVIAKVDERWIRASLDRLVEGCPDGDGRCGLEVKTRSAYKARDYRGEEVPDDVLAQTTWGLIATGLNHMHVAVLLGGQKLLSFRVDRDPVLEGYLIEAAEKVWQAVLEGNPPEVHPDADGVLLAQLNEIYTKRLGERELPAKAAEYLEDYRGGNELERQGKQIKTRAKSALVQMLDDGEVGLLDGDVVFTYTAPDPSDQVTADSLRDLRRDNPELYEALREDGLISESTPNPRFNLKRKRATND